MDHIPTGSILLLLLTDVALVVGMSAAYGAAIARATASRVWLGALIGLLLPVVGPLGWLVNAAVRDSTFLALRRASERDRSTLVPVGLLGLAALLFAVATPLPWAHASGGYDDYSLATDASPSDSIVGAIATVGSALLLGVLVLLVLVSSARQRVSVVAGFVAGLWLVATLDSLVVISAVDGLAQDVTGASGGKAVAEASGAPALWACLAAAVLTLVAAVWLMVDGVDDGTTATAADEWTPQASTPAPGAATAVSWGAAGSWGADPTPSAGSGWGTPASQWGDDDRGSGSW